ncbi:ABC transporter ATP-binding protein [Martelella alba]|uniref:ABC transporter ATP-binding protein n=1 Tax=Martelella alba TaxID=2590451 RepID=A0A506U1G4_9HYPH|nr:ABC transporter ATP-binding protein [Martelella alba]TPW26775.1 ABC transporter ATP-binding protein [Martelella alba]
MNPITEANTDIPSIWISALRKSYGQTDILKGINLKVPAGTYLCLLGPSGCGKTTLLRCIAGLEHPSAGRLDVMGRTMYDESVAVPVPAEKRGLGMVFQHYALWPHMRVFDNIAFPMRQKKFPTADIETRVSDLADLIGLRPLLDRFPGQLSGGQQQRVALARALCSEPSILLLDEPLSNLDSGLRNQLRRELRNIHDRLGMTSVMVTHDQDEAMALADMVAVVHQGEIVQYGPPAEVLLNPATRYVAGFVGYDNMLEGIVVDRTETGSVTLDVKGTRVSVQTSGQFAIGETCAIGLKSKELVVAKEAGINRVPAKVDRLTRLGPSLEIEITVAGQSMLVSQTTDGTAAPAVNDTIFLTLPQSAPLLH